MSQPSLFIGSSTERLEYAEALQSVLDRHFLTKLWTYGVFLPGEGTLASLIERAKQTDFAALFLTPDDEVLVRGEYLKVPRDNLVFELGLFIGRIGALRTFFLVPRDGVDLPSDLQGITPIDYRADRDDGDLLNAVNPAATMIRLAAKKLGARTDKEEESNAPGPSIAPEVFTAIGRLGAVAEAVEGNLSIEQSADNKHEVSLINASGLCTSVVVDLADSASVESIDHLGQKVRSQGS
ncbi:MAG: TIR domain-containing protein [Solirubrobacterales bacterium]